MTRQALCDQQRLNIIDEPRGISPASDSKPHASEMNDAKMLKNRRRIPELHFDTEQICLYFKATQTATTQNGHRFAKQVCGTIRHWQVATSPGQSRFQQPLEKPSTKLSR